ncbi:MAG: DUF4974 domain-containing protein [Sphingomonas sp.]|nr:MAG: DUF4974 domain-containing protein [Sphingomonas sp.]
MTHEHDQAAYDAAACWAARIQDPSFDDWDGHVAWLEGDPRRAALYCEAEAALSDSLRTFDALMNRRGSIAANDDEPVHIVRKSRLRRGLLIVPAALAASLVAIIVERAPMRQVEVVHRTLSGERRMVSLADGSKLTLNGDSAIRVKGRAGRQVLVDRGEVFVDVVHRDDDPFTIVAGGSTFEDVGTAFNVRLDSFGVTLAVSEGEVAYEPARANVTLVAGSSISIDRTRNRVHVSRVEASAVGAWRAGRLVYVDEPVERVAIDLSRSIGVPVSATSRAARRRFTGVVSTSASGEQIVNSFAGLAELSRSRDRKGWRLDVRSP